MALSEEAIEKQREYYRQYYKANKERINARNRKRYHADKEKFKQYQQRYWERKAEEISQ